MKLNLYISIRKFHQLKKEGNIIIIIICKDPANNKNKISRILDFVEFISLREFLKKISEMVFLFACK